MRYFIEIAYKGTHFNGIASQTVGDVRTVQQTLEQALHTILKEDIATTTSSRTDAGVHASQNYLHFDTEQVITAKHVYQLNAILPNDMFVANVHQVNADAHSRFDALYRRYEYTITQRKNPFLEDTAWLYPFAIDIELLHQCASILASHTDFATFCKKHTDTYTTQCTIQASTWQYNSATQTLVYTVQANRFLRGMVRALVATMLEVARGKISIAEFESIISSGDNTKANFSAVAKGLCLVEVAYGDNINAKLIS
ncbi:MAG: hypothetical protein RL660_2887 [Bacteroidota bacterium]